MSRSSIWRNLNVFVAAFAVIASFGSVIVVIPASMLMKAFLPAREAELVAHPLSLALIAAGLIFWWWKHGLSPIAVNPARERSFRWGHVLLAASNLTLTLIFLPSLLGNLALPRQAPAVTGVLVSLMTLVPIALIAGLVMVSRSRATVPAFADTLPVARDASVRDTTTWLARQLGEKTAKNPDPSGRAPSAIVVVVGLVASSLMLFIAGVFGALGFQSDPSRFTNVVLPILIAMYVFYVSTGIFLLTRRRSSAIWVAWAPVGLLTVGLPVLQLIFVLFRSLVGR